MLKTIYLLITAVIIFLSVWELFNEKNWKKQLTYIIVLVPLLLRVLLIK